MQIYLVRHGESQANVDGSIHVHTADHAIPLSERGERQADAAGVFLHGHFQSLGESFGKVRLWNSPYRRARQTADAIERRIAGFVQDRHEHLLLCEQQFGLFDGITDEASRLEIIRKYPDEYEHYKKCERFEGSFWARMPLGESKFDLSTRVHQSFGTFHRDLAKSGIENIVIVAHGSTNRAFIMMWLHHPFEWFGKERNPLNCSVRLISDNKDLGYVYEGGTE